MLAQILLDAGVREPEAEHIQLLERLVYSQKPSAKADFPNGITIARNYDILEVCGINKEIDMQLLTCPGITDFPELGLRIVCQCNGNNQERTATSFAVAPRGEMVLRARAAGDTIRLSGGTKSLKKIFIDQKIPVHRRGLIPVIADDEGVLGVVGFGANLDRLSNDNEAVRICVEYL